MKRRHNQSQTKIAFWKKIALIIFGLFLGVLFIEAGLRLGGLVLSSLQEYRNMHAVIQKGTYRIMCLGESTTAGRYPSFLEDMLNQRNIGVRFSVINKGSPAINTGAILSELDDNLYKYKPDMVIVMMGINDFWPYIPREALRGLEAPLAIRSLKIYKLMKIMWFSVAAQLKATQAMLPQNKNQDEPEEITAAVEPGLENGYKEALMGWSYVRKTQFSQAAELFKKAIERDSSNDSAYVGLGWCYQDKLQQSQAEEMFKKALELNPQNYEAYLGLGWRYKEDGKFTPAEEAVKKVIQFSPQGDRLANSWIYKLLGEIYQEQKKFTLAEDAYKKALEFNPLDDKTYGAMEILYLEEGNESLSVEYAEKAERVRNEYYQEATRNNYLKLRDTLGRENITLVCSQYPNRSVEPLKNIFIAKDNIIFVDNKKSFKEAIAKTGYWDYFKDMYGGDFGHCTERGDRLLAENIAAVILRGVFGRE